MRDLFPFQGKDSEEERGRTKERGFHNIAYVNILVLLVLPMEFVHGSCNIELLSEQIPTPLLNSIFEPRAKPLMRKTLSKSTRENRQDGNLAYHG